MGRVVIKSKAGKAAFFIVIAVIIALVGMRIHVAPWEGEATVTKTQYNPSKKKKNSNGGYKRTKEAWYVGVDAPDRRAEEYIKISENCYDMINALPDRKITYDWLFDKCK